MPPGLYVGLSSGNVGIGTTGLAGTSNAVNLTTSGASGAITVLANGNVGIGTTNPTQKLHVNGNIYSPGLLIQNVTFLLSSPGGVIPTTTWASTGVKVTITPKFNNSKFRVNFSTGMTYADANARAWISLYRKIGTGSYVSLTEYTYAWGFYGGSAGFYAPINLVFIDTPNTALPIEYNVYNYTSEGGVKLTIHSGSYGQINVDEIIA